MADLAIRDDDWNNLSGDEQQQIQNIFPDDSITPSADAAAVSASEPPSRVASDSSACELGCQAAYEAARLACGRLSGRAKYACYAIAFAASLVCSARCKASASSALSGDSGDSGGNGASGDDGNTGEA